MFKEKKLYKGCKKNKTFEVKKESSKNKHKEMLRSLRLKKLEEKMKTNMKKRKKILKKN